MPHQPRIHKVHYTNSYLKAYTKTPKQIKALQKKKEQLFREKPFHPSLKTHKLKGKYQPYHSYSITHHWRILFRFISGTEVIFYDIGTHKIYK